MNPITFIYEAERIYMKDGANRLLAEVTFPTSDGLSKITHTFVDGSLRGQGVAGRLMEAAAQHIRQNGWKATLTCPYSVKWFAAHPEESDLLL